MKHLSYFGTEKQQKVSSYCRIYNHDRDPKNTNKNTIYTGLIIIPFFLVPCLFELRSRGGVVDTRIEAKVKDTKKIRGQGQGEPFREQTLSRPRTGMLEAKAKDQGHKRKFSPKKTKKKGLQIFF